MFFSPNAQDSSHSVILAYLYLYLYLEAILGVGSGVDEVDSGIDSGMILESIPLGRIWGRYLGSDLKNVIST